MHSSLFCNYNIENHSKNYQVHYNPRYMEDHQPIVRWVSQQQKTFTNNDHENSNLNNIINVQKSRYINNNYVVVEDNKCIPMSKRSSKKDRHSKINTARGPRDRRMRLSLDVAKKFFRLQDMLGFDKASNTIEWLIMKSKPAIRDLLSQQQHSYSQRASCSLIRSLNSGASSGSECEVLSDIDHDQSLDKTGEADQAINNKKLITSDKSNKEEKKKVEHRGARKSVYIDQTLAKETREKARERARKRTSDKRNFKFGGGSSDQYTRVLIRPSLDKVNTNRLGSWIPFGENQLHTTTATDHQQPEYPSSSHSTQFKQAGNIAGENSSVMMSNNWMPSTLFNYHNNPAGSSSHHEHMHHHHQFSDFQIQGKTWAGIDN